MLVLAALSSPLWLPFFTNDVVDEAFPALSVAERESVRNMPEAQREVLMAMSEGRGRVGRRHGRRHGQSHDGTGQRDAG